MGIFDIKIERMNTYENVPKDFVPAMLLPAESVIAKSKKRIFFSACTIRTNFNLSAVFDVSKKLEDIGPFLDIEIVFLDEAGNEKTLTVCNIKEYKIE